MAKEDRTKVRIYLNGANTSYQSAINLARVLNSNRGLPTRLGLSLGQMQFNVPSHQTFLEKGDTDYFVTASMPGRVNPNDAVRAIAQIVVGHKYSADVRTL